VRLPVAAGITVVLVPPAQRRQNPARYRIASTDVLGAFTIGGIPPGSYKLFAWENAPTGAYLNADVMKAYEERGTTIDVSGGTTLSPSISLIPAAK
jgi:hypothetical protein